MFTGLPQSLALLGAVLAYYVLDNALLLRYDRLRAYGSSRSWSYTAFAVAAALALILQPIFWPGLGLRLPAGWGLALQIVGGVCVIAALSLHWWARNHLRQFFGERVEIQPGQTLIRTGPYAFVRHPIYTSFLTLSFGVLLINPAVTTAVIMLYSLWDFTQITRHEDGLLAASLPGYADYMREVPRFFPNLFKRRS